MPSTGPNHSVPTIVLERGSPPPQYPVLRIAPRVFRLFAALALGGAFVLWSAAELCELGLELLYHLRARGHGLAA